jgi:uncharacterized glyoxalase superfamily protein PhnB
MEPRLGRMLHGSATGRRRERIFPERPVSVKRVTCEMTRDSPVGVASVSVCDTDAVTATKPPGYHSVTPRMVVADVAGAVGFLRAVFGAAGELQEGRPAEMRIGDSLVMVSQADQRERFPAFLYVYVDDADLVHGRAVAAGAVTLEEPLDTPYGDRRAMVSDRWGNIYQIAHRRIST